MEASAQDDQTTLVLNSTEVEEVGKITEEQWQAMRTIIETIVNHREEEYATALEFMSSYLTMI